MNRERVNAKQPEKKWSKVLVKDQKYGWQIVRGCREVKENKTENCSVDFARELSVYLSSTAVKW